MVLTSPISCKIRKCHLEINENCLVFNGLCTKLLCDVYHINSPVSRKLNAARSLTALWRLKSFKQHFYTSM